MAGRPQRRAREELAKAHGAITEPSETAVEVQRKGAQGQHAEVTVRRNKDGSVDKRQFNKGQSRETMLALVERRRELAAAGDKDALGGRARTKFTRAEITERTLARLEPKALKVLAEQVDDPNLDPSDRRAAAIKILEYRRGKPTQAVKVDSTQVTTIRFETAAWVPGMENASSASVEMGDALELAEGEFEDVSDD